MPLNPSLKKVMVIGSGPIVIGQAAEFDYAGTQACKALKEQGLQVVLVNSNPATLMTDTVMADAIYIEPLIPETIKRIIEKEKPDSLLSTLGGQTGLTLSMQLAKEGFLAEHGVQLLGAKPDTIDKAEDRQLFKDTMESIGEPCIPSKVVTDIDAALEFAQSIGYPVIVKPIDLGSSVGIRKALDRQELSDAMEYAFQFAHKVLVERAVPHLKEINCSILGDYEEAEASECEEPVSSDRILTYEEKYLRKEGGKTSAKGGSEGMASLSRKIPADITPEERDFVRKTAVKAFQALDCCGVSRIDFMMDSETREIWINEINTIPGSLSFYLWEPMGVKYTELLDRMIQFALKRERDQAEISYAFDTNILSGVSFGGTKGSKL